MSVDAKTLEQYRDHLYTRMGERCVPHRLQPGLCEYIVERRPTGDFLKSVLSNNLLEAVRRADPISAAGLPNLVQFLDNHVPQGCYGSPEKVEAWLADKRDIPVLFE